MRTITETFTAGEIKAFGIPGERFELISAVGPVSVSLQDVNGIELTNGLSQNIVAGSYMQEGRFSRIAITSPTAQTLTFVLANGDSGTRSVAGTVVNDVIGAGCRTDNFIGNAAVGNNQVTQHIAPGANLNGLLIRSIALAALASASGPAYLNLYAALVAPVTLTPNQANCIRLGAVACAAGAANVATQAVDVMYRKIPAGWGLFSVTTVQIAAATSISANVSYEIL
jgi:hypothetical protein